MAKVSAVNKNDKRIKLSDKLYKKRQNLKKIIMDKKLPLEERFKAQQKLSQMPRNSAKTRVMNRCKITGRPHGVYRKLKISRIALRDLGLAGLIPGTVLELNDIPFQDFRNYRVDNSKSIKDFKHKPEKTVETEVTVLAKLLKENRIQNPEAEIYHNGVFLKNNTEVLNVR